MGGQGRAGLSVAVCGSLGSGVWKAWFKVVSGG